MVDNLDAVLEKAYRYNGVEELPNGHNWFKLPEGIQFEVIQALPGVVSDYCKVKPR